MPVQWPTSGIPLNNTAPTTNLAGSLAEGAKAMYAGPLAKAELDQSGSKTSLLANAARPEMMELQNSIAKGTLKTQDIENAVKTYGMVQNILGPSAMAAQSGDMATAERAYNDGYAALKNAGMDPAQFGAPTKFDPNYVKNAFQNNSQQLAMAKQAMEFASMQSNIARNDSTVGINNARQQQIAYETGMPVGGQPSGAFSFPGQAAPSGGGMTGANMSGLTPKAQNDLRLKQAESAITTRANLAEASGRSRTQEGLLNEAKEILEKNPNITGFPGTVSKYASSDVQRLEKIYNDVTLGKLSTDYANQGLGALDLTVFNTLKSTMPTVGDFSKNQKTAIENALAGVKSKQIANDVAVKLNQAGVYDENLRAQIGNQIAAGLNVKTGQAMRLDNFKNAPSVINKVLKQHGINSGQQEDTASTHSDTTVIKQKLIGMGLSQAEQDAYLALLPKKA